MDFLNYIINNYSFITVAETTLFQLWDREIYQYLLRERSFDLELEPFFEVLLKASYWSPEQLSYHIIRAANYDYYLAMWNDIDKMALSPTIDNAKAGIVPNIQSYMALYEILAFMPSFSFTGLSFSDSIDIARTIQFFETTRFVEAHFTNKPYNAGNFTIFNITVSLREIALYAEEGGILAKFDRANARFLYYGVRMASYGLKKPVNYFKRSWNHFITLLLPQENKRLRSPLRRISATFLKFADDNPFWTSKKNLAILKAKEMMNSGLDYKNKSLWNKYIFNVFTIQNPYFLKHGFVDFLFKKNVTVPLKPKRKSPYKNPKLTSKDIFFLKEFLSECSDFIGEINVNINNNYMNNTEGIFSNNDTMPRKKKPSPPVSLFLGQMADLLDPKLDKSEILTTINDQWASAVSPYFDRIDARFNIEIPTKHTIFYNTEVNNTLLYKDFPFYNIFLSLDNYMSHMAKIMIDYNMQKENHVDRVKWITKRIKRFRKRHRARNVRPSTSTNDKKRVLLNQRANFYWDRKMSMIKAFYQEFFYNTIKKSEHAFSDGWEPNKDILIKNRFFINRGEGWENMSFAHPDVAAKFDGLSTYLNAFFPYYMSKKKLLKEHRHFSDIQDLHLEFLKEDFNNGKNLDIFEHKEFSVLSLILSGFEKKSKVILHEDNITKINNLIVALNEHPKYFLNVLDFYAHNLKNNEQLYIDKVNRKNFFYDINKEMNFNIEQNLLPFDYFTLPQDPGYTYLKENMDLLEDWFYDHKNEAQKETLIKEVLNIESLDIFKKVILDGIEEKYKYKDLSDKKLLKEDKDERTERRKKSSKNLKNTRTHLNIISSQVSQHRYEDKTFEKNLLAVLFNLHKFYLPERKKNYLRPEQSHFFNKILYKKGGAFWKYKESRKNLFGKIWNASLYKILRYNLKAKSKIIMYKTPFDYEYYPEFSSYWYNSLLKDKPAREKTVKLLTKKIRNNIWRDYYEKKYLGRNLVQNKVWNSIIDSRRNIFKKKDLETRNFKTGEKDHEWIPEELSKRDLNTIFNWKFNNRPKYTYYTKVKAFFSFLKDNVIRQGFYYINKRKYYTKALPYARARYSSLKKNRGLASNTLNLRLASLNSNLSSSIKKMVDAEKSKFPKKKVLYHRNELNYAVQTTLRSMKIIKNNLERYGFIFKKDYKFIKSDGINDRIVKKKRKHTVNILKNTAKSIGQAIRDGVYHSNHNTRRLPRMFLWGRTKVYKKPTYVKYKKHMRIFSKSKWNYFLPRGKRKSNIRVNFAVQVASNYRARKLLYIEWGAPLDSYAKKYLKYNKTRKYYRHSSDFISYISSIINRGRRHTSYKFNRKNYSRYYLKKAEETYNWRKPNKGSKGWLRLRKKWGKDAYAYNITPNNNWLEQYPFKDIFNSNIKNKRDFNLRPLSKFYPISFENSSKKRKHKYFIFDIVRGQSKFYNLLEKKNQKKIEFTEKNTKNQLYHIKENFLWEDLLKIYDSHFYNNSILDFFLTREKFVDNLLFEKLRYKYFLKISEEISKPKESNYNILNFNACDFTNDPIFTNPTLLKIFIQERNKSIQEKNKSIIEETLKPLYKDFENSKTFEQIAQEDFFNKVIYPYLELSEINKGTLDYLKNEHILIFKEIKRLIKAWIHAQKRLEDKEPNIKDLKMEGSNMFRRLDTWNNWYDKKLDLNYSLPIKFERGLASFVNDYKGLKIDTTDFFPDYIPFVFKKIPRIILNSWINLRNTTVLIEEREQLFDKRMLERLSLANIENDYENHEYNLYCWSQCTNILQERHQKLENMVDLLYTPGTRLKYDNVFFNKFATHDMEPTPGFAYNLDYFIQNKANDLINLHKRVSLQKLQKELRRSDVSRDAAMPFLIKDYLNHHYHIHFASYYSNFLAGLALVEKCMNQEACLNLFKMTHKDLYFGFKHGDKSVWEFSENESPRVISVYANLIKELFYGDVNHLNNNWDVTHYNSLKKGVESFIEEFQHYPNPGFTKHWKEGRKEDKYISDLSWYAYKYFESANESLKYCRDITLAQFYMDRYWKPFFSKEKYFEDSRDAFEYPLATLTKRITALQNIRVNIVKSRIQMADPFICLPKDAYLNFADPTSPKPFALVGIFQDQANKTTNNALFSETYEEGELIQRIQQANGLYNEWYTPNEYSNRIKFPTDWNIDELTQSVNISMMLKSLTFHIKKDWFDNEKNIFKPRYGLYFDQWYPEYIKFCEWTRKDCMKNLMDATIDVLKGGNTIDDMRIFEIFPFVENDQTELSELSPFIQALTTKLSPWNYFCTEPCINKFWLEVKGVPMEHEDLLLFPIKCTIQDPYYFHRHYDNYLITDYIRKEPLDSAKKSLKSIIIDLIKIQKKVEEIYSLTKKFKVTNNWKECDI